MSVYRVALAGNPNTGKSTLFNTLTGLNQHTGNWPGKTVLHAEGKFHYNGEQFLVVDLPGTYSLFSNSADEEVARDYIVFDQPDVTIAVLDATSLERNLNLALQVLEMTERTVVCINLIDEADKRGIEIDEKQLREKLGVPVVKISARNKKGIEPLLQTLDDMVKGRISTSPYRIAYSPEIEEKLAMIETKIAGLVGRKYPARWLALRILDGDNHLLEKLEEKMAQAEKEVSQNGV